MVTEIAVLRRVRRDALPEEIQYRDGGCDIHSQCLTCPLPRCRYDEPGGVRAMLNGYRDEQIAALRRAGAPVGQIAERYNLSRRTVFRILSSASGGIERGPSEDTGVNSATPLQVLSPTRPASEALASDSRPCPSHSGFGDASAGPKANGGNGHRQSSSQDTKEKVHA